MRHKTKTEIIHIRCTNQEKNRIKNLSKELGISITQFINDAIDKYENNPKSITSVKSEEIKFYVRLLEEYRTNFSRISNLIKEHDVLKKQFKTELEDVIANINSHINLIKF